MMTDHHPIKILYAEDDKVDQMAFERWVQDQGLAYDYTIAGSSRDVQLKLQADCFDVIVTDYNLGDGTAFEFFKDAGDTPLILVTGMGDEEIAVKAIKQGAYDYLTKDPNHRYLQILPMAVESAIAHRAAQQALKESEQRFRIMADTAPVMIWMSGPDRGCTYVNKTWLNFTGRAEDQELGDGWMDRVHPDDAAVRREAYHAACQARQPFRIEYRLQRSDGKYRWVLDSGTPRLTTEKRLLGYIGSCIDISDRKELETRQQQLLCQVERSHADLLSILNQLRIGAVLVDEAGRVTFASQSCRKLMQKEESDIVGRQWEQVCPISDEHKPRLQEMAGRPQGDRDKLSVSVDGPEGQQFWVDVEIQDDPRHTRRRMFFLYDMTAVHDLRQLLNEQATAYGIVGKSPAMRVVYDQIAQLARLDTTVLIEGDTGTGKELVARGIHTAGHRQDRPFVAINCAGLAESLLASQLFGHRRGAFTGAVEDRAGHFEAANHGTLFLDEIGDISPSVQTSLLRVLQEREVLRIGESKPRPVDVRIIAATHRDLNIEVQEGRFRADLLYRIRVARIALPPLRDRRVDIPLLVQTFLRSFRASCDKQVEEISQQAMRLLMDYAWPGNVRELQSAVEFAAIRCRSPIITPEDLPPEILGTARNRGDALGDLESERDRILAALTKAGGNRTLAARLLDISRATLYRRLSELNIKRDK